MYTEQIFLNIISDYINNKHILPPKDTNWEEIIKLAEIHSLHTMLYLSVGDFIKDKVLHDRLKYDFLASVKNSVNQEIAMEQLIKKLTENNIDHMLMKGYILRNYYPDKESRTFGDIDFLIKEEDREKSHEIILGLGYEYHKDHFIKQVYTYSKNNVVLEVHTDIIYNSSFLDYDYRGYFREKVKNKQLIKGCTYELKKEDHFLYIMVHLASHFYNAGIGVRMLLDIAVFLNKFAKEMDMYYINNELKKIKLSKFSNTIYYICNKYFDVAIECQPIIETEIKYIMNYILGHGTFGFMNKDIFDINYHKEHKGFISVFRERFFPKYEIMKQRNNWFKNGKKFMLPYAWIRRWFEFILFKNKRSQLHRKLNAIFIKGNDSDKHNKILEMIGLK